MRSEGFLFLSGGSGGGTRVRSDFGIAAANDRERPRATAHVRFVPDALCP